MNSSESFAQYDPDSSCWRTSQISLLTGWEQFSESWPRQGMTQNGRAYERRMWAPAIAEIGGGALPTPRASTAMAENLANTNGRPINGRLENVVAAKMLPLSPDGKPYLPTPSACVANDGEKPDTWLARRERVKVTAKGGKGNGNGMGMPLTIAAQLLPTPTTRDWKDGSQQACANTPPNGLLGREIHQVAGSTPTGDPMYLNPYFVEEMQGFPVGWTDLKHSETP
jgi:hypothetical protein